MWVKKYIKLHTQNISCHYNDKNVDTVSNEKKAEEQDDLIHKIKCMKQKEYWKANIELFWINQKNDQSFHDTDKLQWKS